jgi:hypothetical protein
MGVDGHCHSSILGPGHDLKVWRFLGVCEVVRSANMEVRRFGEARGLLHAAVGATRVTNRTKLVREKEP